MQALPCCYQSIGRVKRNFLRSTVCPVKPGGVAIGEKPAFLNHRLREVHSVNSLDKRYQSAGNISAAASYVKYCTRLISDETYKDVKEFARIERPVMIYIYDALVFKSRGIFSSEIFRSWRHG